MGLWQWLSRGRARQRAEAAFSWEPASLAVSFEREGRRYLADTPYLLPKDEVEAARLNYQHFLLRRLLKGNCYAPVQQHLLHGGRVLDVGCGTGRWGHEIAVAFPRCQVVGLDLEEMAAAASPPRNYRFEPGNVLTGLPFAAHTFDYVHQRLLVAGIPLTRWPGVMAELKRVTVPGGWIELIEMGQGFHQAGPATRQLLGWGMEIARARGIDASSMRYIGLWLKQAGLGHMRAETRVIPVGSWGGRLGNLMGRDLLSGWPALRPLAQSMLGVSPQVFDEALERLEDEWKSYHTTYEIYLACGQVMEGATDG